MTAPKIVTYDYITIFLMVGWMKGWCREVLVRRYCVWLKRAALLSLFIPALVQAAGVVIVKSKDFPIYDKAIAGFEEALGRSVPTVVMKGKLADPAALAQEVSAQKPQVILAIGLWAIKALQAEISDTPIVFCLASNPIGNKLHKQNSTGVAQEPSARAQLKAFRQVLPKVKRIGIIYDPTRTGDFVQAAQKAALAQGIELVASAVKKKQEVPAALQALVEQVQALWLIRDATVISKEFFRYTLIVQFEKKIPLLVYHPMFVKKQAVCSFAADYEAQGRTAAELVKKILQGGKPADLPIQAPPGTLTINLNSAAKTGVVIPERVLKRKDVIKLKS